jgi:LytS/YehU family sensor histidine kinase
MHTGPVPARVRVTVESDRGAGLVLTVSNTGQLVPDDRPAPMLQGSRIALDDLRERLAALYPGRHQFTLEQDDGWVRARVRIGAAS